MYSYNVIYVRVASGNVQFSFCFVFLSIISLCKYYIVSLMVDFHVNSWSMSGQKPLLVLKYTDPELFQLLPSGKTHSGERQNSLDIQSKFSQNRIEKRLPSQFDVQPG